ncbi:tyrosine-type recombinase/integrase [Verrucomicrobiota bacterium]
MRKRTGYLIRRGKVFYAVWTVAGKKYTKTTGQRDRRKAETELRRIMEPFTVGDEITTLQNIAARIEGRTAELARMEEDRNPLLTVAAAWEAYERAGNRREISEGTLRNYDCYWTAFTRWLAATHPEVNALRDVSFDICEGYKEHMAGLKVTGRTFNAHRAFLRSFFNVLAEKAKLPNGNPWAKIAKRNEHSLSRRPFTVEELRNVCRSAEGELRTLFALGLYLGARMGDAACMDWGNVDMARRLIRFTPRKTARKNPDPLLIPMHPELAAILGETPPEKRKGPVCPDLAERYARRGADGVSNLVQGHLEACGIATTGERNGAGVRRYVAAGFHSLRHSAVSLMREAGAAQSISQAIVGHNSPEVHALYTHTDEEALRRAVGTLPAVIGDNAASELPASDAAAALRENVRELADKLNGRTWRSVKTELLSLAEKGSAA